MDEMKDLGMVEWPSHEAGSWDDDPGPWVGKPGKSRDPDPWGVLNPPPKPKRDEEALGYDEDPHLSVDLQVEARPLKSSQFKRPIVPRLKLPTPSGTPSRASFRDIITPSWWESKNKNLAFGPRAPPDSARSGHSTPGDPSWHTFSDLRPSGRFADYRQVRTARERHTSHAWDAIEIAPKTERSNLNTAPAHMHLRPQNSPPLTSVRLREVPLQTSGLKTNDIGGTVREQLLSGYRHPYGLSFHDSPLRCPFAPPGTASSGLLPATPRSLLTGRSQTATERSSSNKSANDDVKAGNLLSSRRLTNTAVARTRMLQRVQKSERRAYANEMFQQTERKARSSWMPPAAAVDLREMARRNKTLGAIERMLHLSSKAGRAELHSLFEQFCGSEEEAEEEEEAQHVEGLLDLMVELEVLSLVDVRTGLRVRHRDEGRPLRREDGLLPRAELLEVVQGVVAGLGQRSYRLPEAELASCLQILADRALYRAGTVAREAEQQRRKEEREEREKRAREDHPYAHRHGHAAASEEEKRAEKRIGMVGRSGHGGRRREPGPCRGKPQRLVEAERLNLRSAQAHPDAYTIRLWH